VWSERNLDRLSILAADGTVADVDVPFTSIGSVQVSGDGIVAIAGSPTAGGAVVRIALPSGEVELLKTSRASSVDPAYVSVPEAIEYPTEGGRTAHAFFYAPVNPEFTSPGGELPPLIVMSHGGPTSATTSVLDLGRQYWTSRGFAVVDVNYGGSTGYGREYRDRLQGSWGIVDVDDCVHAARWLADQGRVDGERMVIRGGSAGGYTTLAALAFRDVFAAGASHFGVADAEALAKDTHKFESRYLDGLIGPYPEARDVYVERSPIHHTDSLDKPMILFQGLEDKVVPPEQAEMMAEALRAKGIPFAYVPFEGEQHGFRQAATIVRVAEAELWFYGRVLGFGPGDEIEPVRIENEEALPSWD
jgi:dipeptidyl aminopeptidase/acylaminoacyl peptidase